MRSAALIAVTRFGLGPRPGELTAAAADPAGFVAAQCSDPDVVLIHGMPTTDEIRELYIKVQSTFVAARAEAKGSGPEAEVMQRTAGAARNDAVRDLMFAEIGAKFEHALATDQPFLERLVLFWTNHFAIDRSESMPMRMLAGNFERVAIRPFVLGRFADMLAAATLHPAMLIYLDNDRSVAALSRIGKRRGGARANENLARELLELHTLGAGGGYTQDDVGAVANALAGWNGGFSVRRENVFEPRWHDPAARIILGRRYPEGGPEQIGSVLPDLAAHPSTARHLARKFARHFVGDGAPATLVDALEASFRSTGGDLRAFTLTLVGHDAAWHGEATKTVPPYDFMLGAGRALGLRRLPPNFVVRSTRDLAHEVMSPPSPAGWPDDDGAFLGGDSLLERIDFAGQLAERQMPPDDVRAFAAELFGDDLSPVVAEAVARAEDRRQALVLVLMSPAFQRR